MFRSTNCQGKLARTFGA